MAFAVLNDDLLKMAEREDFHPITSKESPFAVDPLEYQSSYSVQFDRYTFRVSRTLPFERRYIERYFYKKLKLFRNLLDQGQFPVEVFCEVKKKLERQCENFMREKVLKNTVWRQFPSLFLLCLTKLPVASVLEKTQCPYDENVPSLFGFFSSLPRIKGFKVPKCIIWEICEEIVDKSPYPWVMGGFPAFRQMMEAGSSVLGLPKSFHEREKKPSYLSFFTLFPLVDSMMHLTVLKVSMEQTITRFVKKKRFQGKFEGAFKIFVSERTAYLPLFRKIYLWFVNEDGEWYQAAEFGVFLDDVDHPPGRKKKNESKFVVLSGKNKLVDLNEPETMRTLQNPVALCKKLNKIVLWKFSHVWIFRGSQFPKNTWLMLNFLDGKSRTKSFKFPFLTPEEFNFKLPAPYSLPIGIDSDSDSSTDSGYKRWGGLSHLSRLYRQKRLLNGENLLFFLCDSSDDEVEDKDFFFEWMAELHKLFFYFGGYFPNDKFGYSAINFLEVIFNNFL